MESKLTAGLVMVFVIAMTQAFLGQIKCLGIIFKYLLYKGK
jgi:hypothetical protein